MEYVSKYGLKIFVNVTKTSEKYVWFERNGLKFKYKREKFELDFKRFK